jgi:hypothetical protein
MERTTDCHHEIADARLPPAAPVGDDATAFDTPVDMRNAPSAIVPGLGGPLLVQGACRAAWLLARPEALALGQPQRQQAQSLPQPAPRGQGRRRRVSHGLLRGAAALGVTEHEAEAQGLDAQAILHRVGFGLAALTRGLLSRSWGAAEAACRPVMGTRGEAGAAAGMIATGAGASSRGATPGAAAASETPRRWARAVRERAGAAPRLRRAATSAGSRTCIHCWAWRWPSPPRRPGPTWRLDVCREGRRKHRRSSGAGRGQVV